MAHPLDGCFAKIARATEQFECLKAKIAPPAFDPNSITFGQQFHPEVSAIQVTIEGVPEIPIEWGLAAGDALQNLRSALNYLAWELAKWNLAQRGASRDPDRRTQFPINTRAREFSAYMVTDLHPDHVAEIQRLQPNGADHLAQIEEFDLRESPVEGLAADHPLATLASLTNIDKHQTLQPTIATQRRYIIDDWVGLNCIIKHRNIFLLGAFYNGATYAVADVTPIGPEPKVQVKDVLSPGVAFGGWPIDYLMGEVLPAVLKIARKFEPIF